MQEVLLDIHSFADQYLQPYKMRKREIIAKTCPFCNAQEKDNEYKFHLNLDKRVYRCFRGKCGESGHYNQLRKHFGLRPENDKDFIPKVKFSKPKLKYQSPDKRGIAYLKSRGISEETINHFKVTASDKEIAFNYYLEGELTYIKYRSIDEKKFHSEPNARLVLYNIDNCDYETPLVITEGEIDAMSVHEAGHHNVVSIPGGAQNKSFITEHWKFLNNFREIIVFMDNDSAGEKLKQNIMDRIDAWKLFVIESSVKDANEMLVKQGKDVLLEAIKSAKPANGDIVIDLKNIPNFDLDEVENFKSGIPVIDESTKGFRVGELTVVTGYSGGGKSTLINQLVINAIEQGFNSFMYSGELKANFLRYWLELSASCGRARISTEGSAYVPSTEKSAIREWLSERVYVYNNDLPHTKESLLFAMEYTRRRFGCRFFVIDNLMEINLFGKDFYHAQSDFVEELCRFAKDKSCHVLLVAHPNKTEGVLTKKDISGSGNISNKADNIFAVCKDNNSGTTDISVLKNRALGITRSPIGYTFDTLQKRIHFSPDRLGWFDYMPTQQGFDYSE